MSRLLTEEEKAAAQKKAQEGFSKHLPDWAIRDAIAKAQDRKTTREWAKELRKKGQVKDVFVDNYTDVCGDVVQAYQKSLVIPIKVIEDLQKEISSERRKN